MTKRRVFEVAKELNVSNKEILDILEKNNIQAKNHLSTIEDSAKMIVEKHLKVNKEQVAGAKISKPAQENKNVSNENKQLGKNDKMNNEKENSNVNITNKNLITKVEEPKKVLVKPVDNKPVSSNTTVTTTKSVTNNAVKNTTVSNNAVRNTTPVTNTNPPKNTNTSTTNSARPATTARPPYQGSNRPQGNNTAGNPQSRPQTSTTNARPNVAGTTGARPNQPARPPQNNTASTTNRPSSNTAQNQKRGPNVTATSNTTGGSANKPAAKGGSTRPSTYNNRSSNNRNSNNRNQNNRRPNRSAEPAVVREIKRPENIQVAEFITIKDLAVKIKCSPSDIIKKLFLMGMMVTINQDLDFVTATLVANEYGIEVLELPPEQDPTEVPEVEDDLKDRVSRPPVVTVMGHVDHGKTSLLDAIRKANVTAREAGGITQHIGAYQVNFNNRKIVFLDTPGHEAFTAMRARGAKVTDIAILVVAADDGVMPQTIEAINHAKSAEVPIIVAVNKMDKEGANPDVIKQQLATHNLVPEDWGGDTIMVPVSAKQKKGISELLEMVLLVADMQELKANPTIPAVGTIIEAELDKGRGPVATVLVQNGTLNIGDSIVAGTAYGKVRAMINERGEKVKKALPSTPVEVLGLSDVPLAGDVLHATDEKTARSVAEKRLAKKRIEEMQKSQKVSLDDLFQQIQEGKLKQLNILVKADVQGTIEALKQSLSTIKNEEVKVEIVHAGVGAINESDVMLASASNALIIGFNVRPDNNARKAAEAQSVEVNLYRVIYDAINDVEAAIKGMLAPKFEEQLLGKVEVRQVMIINKNPIAGCYVQEGKVTNSAQLRLIREGIVIHEGKIDSLKRFKDDVKEVAAGYECGITLEKFRDIKDGDILEVFIMKAV